MATKKEKVEDEEIFNPMDRTRGIYSTGFVVINCNEYKVLKLTHKIRLKVFSYYSSVQAKALSGEFSFMDTPKYQEIEKVILNNVSCKGIVIGTKDDYFEGELEGDYINLIMTMFDVFSYPLLIGSLTD